MVAKDLSGRLRLQRQREGTGQGGEPTCCWIECGARSLSMHLTTTSSQVPRRRARYTEHPLSDAASGRSSWKRSEKLQQEPARGHQALIAWAKPGGRRAARPGPTSSAERSL